MQRLVIAACRDFERPSMPVHAGKLKSRDGQRSRGSPARQCLSRYGTRPVGKICRERGMAAKREAAAKAVFPVSCRHRPIGGRTNTGQSHARGLAGCIVWRLLGRSIAARFRPCGEGRLLERFWTRRSGATRSKPVRRQSSRSMSVSLYSNAGRGLQQELRRAREQMAVEPRNGVQFALAGTILAFL